MDMIVATGIIIVCATVGVALVMRVMSNRFPVVWIDVRNRGTRRRTKYRVFGDAIVQDNLMKILLGEYTFVGTLSTLEYFLAPDGKRIYDAYARYDYLCGVKPHDKDQAELAQRPIVTFLLNEKGKSVGKVEMGKYLLMPLQMLLVNEKLEEKEVKNGKDIASGFIKAQKNAEQFIQANNPVMAVIISSLPVVILAALLCAVVYIAYMGLGDSSMKVVSASQAIMEAAKNMSCR